MDPDLDGDLGQADYTNLFKRSPIPSLIIDHDRDQVVQANAAALAFLGVEATQVVGRSFAIFQRKTPREHLARIRASRGLEAVGINTLSTSSGPRTVELSVTSAGDPGFAFVQITDLTGLLDTVEQAEARAAELAATSTAMSNVASRLAHDIRGPMGSIAGFADLLLRSQGQLSEEERTRALEKISANTHALASMTASILSEADAGVSRQADDSRDVSDLFSMIQGVTASQLAESHGALEVTASVTHLPVPVGSVRQAVINLVSNSIKYREPDRPLRIEVDVRQGEAGTEIVVRDNGRGFGEDPSTLFAPGVRGASAGATDGAGLGLAFVQAAMEAVDGTVTASTLPVGAEVVLTIPAPPDPTSTDRVGAPARAGLSAVQLDRILDGLPVATLVIDVAVRQIVRANRACVALLGGTEEDLLGLPASGVVVEADVADVLRRNVINEPEVVHVADTYVRTSTGQLAAKVWLTLIEGTSLIVGQMVPRDDPSAES